MVASERISSVLAAMIGGAYAIGMQASLGWLIGAIETGGGWLAIGLILLVQASLAAVILVLLRAVPSFRADTIPKVIVFSAMGVSIGYLLFVGGVWAAAIGGLCGALFSLPSLLVFLYACPD